MEDILKGSAGTVLVLVVLRLLIKLLDWLKLPWIANQIRHLIGDNEKDQKTESNPLHPPRPSE